MADIRVNLNSHFASVKHLHLGINRISIVLYLSIISILEYQQTVDVLSVAK